MHFHVRAWMHSDQQRQRRSTKEKLETSIYTTMEYAKNGLYLVADNDDLTIPSNNYEIERKNLFRKTLTPKKVTSPHTRRILTIN